MFFILFNYLMVLFSLSSKRLGRGGVIIRLIFISFFLSLVFSLRGREHGWDTPYYLDIFYSVNDFSDVFSTYNTDYFFWFLNYLISLFDAGDVFYMFFISFVGVFFLFYGISRLVSQAGLSRFVLFFFFTVLCLSTFYFFNTNALRQFIACSFFVFAVSFRFSNFCLYIIFSLAAFFSHSSVILCILVLEFALRLKGFKFVFLVLFLSIISSFLLSSLVSNYYFLIFSSGGDFTGGQVLMSKSMLYIKNSLIILGAVAVFFLIRVELGCNRIFRTVFYFVILMCSASMLLSFLPDSAERLLMYASLFQSLLITFSIVCFFFQRNWAFGNLSMRIFGVLFFCIFVQGYGLLILLHPSVRYTLGNVALINM